MTRQQRQPVCYGFTLAVLWWGLVAGGAVGPERTFAEDRFPLPAGVRDTQNPADVPLTPQVSLERMAVPPGFHVTLFAGEPAVRRPIAFDFDDRGRLWVVENYSHPVWKPDGASDRVLVFEDTDHDGRYDRRKVFWDGGRYLTAIAVGHGGVWLGNTPELIFVPDRDGNDAPDSPPQVMLDGFQKSTNNVLNNFHWGPDGWLYGAIGLSSQSLVGRPGAPLAERTAITRGIWRFHPVTGKFEKVAEGMVNPWGADFNQYGDLFTTNTVIAHLWQIVPGMYCQRRGVEQDYPYAYGRIQSITDHLHWGGGKWQASRTQEERHSVAGGGHAHCGAMIYLADNWPAEYRGTFFTANLHGNRVNNDTLVPYRSTYRGVHRPDFLLANDPWFRGLTLKYGPDGGVYVSDWHDLGECHDTDGSHRSSGRIYKVVFGRPRRVAPALATATDAELVALHRHANQWYVRRARRILHQRAGGRSIDRGAREALERMFQEREPVTRLEALWTLSLIGELPPPRLTALLRDAELQVRRWAVRLLVDQGAPPAAAVRALRALAASEPSPKVRLALAVALGRLPLDDRWELAASLASHAEDARDPYLPLMIWYGVEPLVARDAPRALRLAADAQIPLVRQYIVRRYLDGPRAPDTQGVVKFVLEQPTAARLDCLRGMQEALQGRGSQPMPPGWDRLHAELERGENAELRSLGVRLATTFGDPRSLRKLRAAVFAADRELSARVAALEVLLELDDGLAVSDLHRLLREAEPLRQAALETLTYRNDPETARQLFEVYPQLSPKQRQAALLVLTTRRDLAEALLTALEEDTVPRADVSAFALQQLRAYNQPELQRRVAALWKDEDPQVQKSKLLARIQQKLTPEFLAAADPRAGRAVFEQSCAKCHRLFGEGGDLGPDLTGSGRQKMDYVLSNLIDPSAVVDPAYRMTLAIMEDGRILSGFMVQHTERFVVLRTQHAQLRLPLDQIERLHTTATSMMPEGMLNRFTDQQIRDLLSYLASPQQVDLP